MKALPPLEVPCWASTSKVGTLYTGQLEREGLMSDHFLFADQGPAKQARLHLMGDIGVETKFAGME